MIITDIKLLRKKNELATKEEAIEIVINLEEELRNSITSGVGLSAPQIGINKKVAIIRIKKDGIEEIVDLVNPKIIDMEGPFINKGEGCLSFPDTYIDTQRYREVFVKDDLHPAGLVFVGFSAVVVFHEVDHLENILLIDRAIGKNKVGRNDLCPCGSKIKAKKCHFK